MKMNNIEVKAGKFSNLPTTPNQNLIYLSYDTKELYIDVTADDGVKHRLRVSDFPTHLFETGYKAFAQDQDDILFDTSRGINPNFERTLKRGKLPTFFSGSNRRILLESIFDQVIDGKITDVTTNSNYLMTNTFTLPVGVPILISVKNTTNSDCNFQLLTSSGTTKTAISYAETFFINDDATTQYKIKVVKNTTNTNYPVIQNITLRTTSAGRLNFNAEIERRFEQLENQIKALKLAKTPFSVTQVTSQAQMQEDVSKFYLYVGDIMDGGPERGCIYIYNPTLDTFVNLGKYFEPVDNLEERLVALEELGLSVQDGFIQSTLNPNNLLLDAVPSVTAITGPSSAINMLDHTFFNYFENNYSGENKLNIDLYAYEKYDTLQGSLDQNIGIQIGGPGGADSRRRTRPIPVKDNDILSWDERYFGIVYIYQFPNDSDSMYSQVRLVSTAKFQGTDFETNSYTIENLDSNFQTFARVVLKIGSSGTAIFGDDYPQVTLTRPNNVTEKYHLTIQGSWSNNNKYPFYWIARSTIKKVVLAPGEYQFKFDFSTLPAESEVLFIQDAIPGYNAVTNNFISDPSANITIPTIIFNKTNNCQVVKIPSPSPDAADQGTVLRLVFRIKSAQTITIQEPATLTAEIYCLKKQNADNILLLDRTGEEIVEAINSLNPQPIISNFAPLQQRVNASFAANNDLTEGVEFQIMSYNVARWNNNGKNPLFSETEKYYNFKRFLYKYPVDCIATQEYISANFSTGSETPSTYLFNPLYPYNNFNTTNSAQPMFTKQPLTATVTKGIVSGSFTSSSTNTARNFNVNWVKLVKNNIELYVFNIHLDTYNANTNAPLWRMEELTAKVNTCLTALQPSNYVFIGDLNTRVKSSYGNDEPIETTALQNVAANVSCTLANGGYLGWIKTLESSYNLGCTDNALVSNSCTITNFESLAEWYPLLYSDHYPVLLTINVPQPPIQLQNN